MPDTQTILKDPNFHTLPLEEKRKVLTKIDTNFKGLPSLEQDKVLGSFKPKPPPFLDPVGPITTGAEFKAAEVAGAKKFKIIKAERREAGKEALIEQGPEEILGTIGGIIGKTPGAALGGAAGEAFSQIIRRVRGKEVPETSLEAAKEIGIAAARQAAFEKGGQVVAGIGGKVLSPFGKSVTPEGRIATETIEQYMPKAKGLSGLLNLKQVGVLSAEATANKPLDILQNITEKSLFGGGTIQTLKETMRPHVMRTMFDDVAEQFGRMTDPKDVAKLFEDTVKGNIKTSRIPAKMMYNNVSDMVKPVYKDIIGKKKIPTVFLDAKGKPLMKEVATFTKEQVGGASVPLKNLKRFVEKDAEILRQLFPEGAGIESAASGDQLIKMVRQLNDNIPYEAAQDLRTRIRVMAESVELQGKKAPAFAKASTLESILTKDIQSELARIDPKALRQWNRANQIWRTSDVRYKNSFMKSLMKSDKFNPKLITMKAFQTPKKALAFKKAINDLKIFDSFARQHIDDVMRRSFKPGTTEIGGDALFNNTFGKSGLGEQAYKNIFGPEKAMTLKRSMTALQLIEKKQGEGVGSFAMMLMQPGAVFTIILGKADAAASIILGGPAIVGRLMTNPIFARYLTNASKLPANSPRLFSLMGRVGELAHKVRTEMQRAGELPIQAEDMQNLKPTSTLQMQQF